MKIPDSLKYTKNDEWIKVEGNIGAIGITDYAQEQLSDIVFAEVIVAVGDEVKRGDNCATIESVKAAADVYAPASGKVIEVNEAISATPEMINSDPYGAWLLKIEISNPNELLELLSAEEYQKKIEEKS